MIGKVIRWQNTYGKIRGFDHVSYFVYVDELVDVLALHPGKRVEFKPVDSEKGPRAEAVRLVESW
jgi:cold shock CspA family protein